MMMNWISLTRRMPNPDKHHRVLIYTEGYEFQGEQVFDVKAETLNENFYQDQNDQPEVCRYATHWHPHPSDAYVNDLELEAIYTMAIAWGWLWHVTTADDRVKTARRLLGQMLDKEMKRYGIQTAKVEGAQVNVQEIEAALLRGLD